MQATAKMCATTCSATPCAISVDGEEVKGNWRLTCIQKRHKSSCRSKQKLRQDSLQILQKIALLLIELIASRTNSFQVSFVYLHTRGTGVRLHPHKNGRDTTVLDGSLEAWRVSWFQSVENWAYRSLHELIGAYTSLQKLRLLATFAVVSWACTV